MYNQRECWGQLPKQCLSPNREAREFYQGRLAYSYWKDWASQVEADSFLSKVSLISCFLRHHLFKNCGEEHLLGEVSIKMKS
jgi:hypothetical protein